MTDYLCSYKPLCYTEEGRRASSAHHIPLFVDHSCRREPDLQALHPTITALCRAGKFAPKLQVGDRVAYITNKTDYGEGIRVRYLVACLRIAQRFETHDAGAKWFRENTAGIPLPSNCVVTGNAPIPSKFTAYPDDHPKSWDNVYQYRAQRWGVFLVCDVDAMSLWSPNVLHDSAIEEIFGRMPGTRNPGHIKPTEYDELVRRCGSGAP